MTTQPHDGSYKRLFSHAPMVKHLLRRYVAQPWVDKLDFDTLELVPAHYVSDELEQREGDLVWRLRYGPGEGEWFYIYMLLELQSTVDRFMAVRLLAYLMLFYQSLIKKGELLPDKMLPPVLPVVLYNGLEEWTAPVQVAELIVPVFGGLWTYVPRFQYLVIDEGHYSLEELEPIDDPVTAVFRLEQSDSVAEIRRIVDQVIGILDRPELRPLQEDMAMWLRRVVLPARVPGVEIPELADLKETNEMLAERVASWPKMWMDEGFQKGQDKGILKGEARIVQRVLDRRFGPLPGWVLEKLEQASEQELEGWTDRALEARSLENVFSS